MKHLIRNKAQNFENLKYDPLEISGNIMFDNSSDHDLHFYNTNIQNLNIPCLLPKELRRFLGDDKDENKSVCTLIEEALIKISKILKCFYRI